MNYLFAGEFHILNLALFLSGSADAGILLSLMLQRSNEMELRNLTAKDI